VPGPFKFAWTGGTITEQQTVVTNGNTHGGIVETLTLVGDVSPGVPILFNIASFSGLEEGALYSVTGPGLSGAFFLYDTSVLTQPGTINLSEAAALASSAQSVETFDKPAGTISSATYVVTKSIVVGSTAAAMTQGSNSAVFVDDIGLLPGIYQISGTGVGETLNPDGQPMFINSAWFEYGGGGSFSMYVFGPTGAQPVTATSSGTFAVLITGLPSADWYTITNIPAGALASLSHGLRYNLSGAGIQVGTTFTAPSGGVTAITLDLPATASAFAAILNITGPRTPNADFDPSIHNREDEEIVGLEISQEEGGFASLTIDIRNPHIGLLALGRNLWCWLSWDNAGTLVPLFNGRLVGVPKLAVDEIVQLQFVARPDDYNEQKGDLVASMSVLPYFDPIWLATNTNPDTVLETYSSLWHVDRTSLELTASDILQGEDGIISIGEDQAFYDAFSLSYGSPPLTAVSISGTVSWQQQGDGRLDITDRLVQAFNAAGSPYRSVFAQLSRIDPAHPVIVSTAPQRRLTGGGLIQVTCGDGLRTDWPKPGTGIGGGWSLSTDNDAGEPLCYIIDADRPNGWLEPIDYNVNYVTQPPPAPPGQEVAPDPNVQILTNGWVQITVNIPLNNYKIRMVLDWRADRTRTETVSAVLTANVQRELSDTADSDHEEIALTSEYVARGIDAGGEVPLGALTRRSYFQTDRGSLSFQYLLLAARAKMRARARAVDVTFAVDWPTALGIGLRNSVTLLDRRLPGGNATGKVKSYKLTVGDGGMFGEFTIGCSIGNEDPTVVVDGVPSYVEDGYVEAGYQVIAGGQNTLVEDELAYQALDNFAIDDDGLDLTNLTLDRAVNECFVVHGLQEQISALSHFQNTITPAGDPLAALATLSTSVTLDLKPVAGNSFNTTFFPAVSQLWLPKTIDLAAPSG
jgi:hypothetical protein